MSGRDAPESESSLLARLHEREQALTAIGHALNGARAGAGTTLFVVGAAGLGKSALLDAARELASGPIDVAAARGGAMEEAVAFGMADQLARSLGAGDLLGLTTERGAAADPADPFHRLLSWLEQRDRRPLLVALEDLHRADPDSLRLFGFLARRIGRLPIVMIATARPWPARAAELVGDLRQAERAEVVELGPLSRAAADQLLVERAATALDEPTMERAWELCGGNPLLVGQVAEALGRGDALPAPGERWRGRDEPLALARFAALEPASLRLAQAACVLGERFAVELAGELAGLADAAFEASVEELCRSGLIVEHDGATRFAHPLLADALYDDLPAPRRRRLHARASALLRARGRERAAAEHAVRADLAGDASAIALLERVGCDALAAGAVASASDLLEAAVRFSGDRPSPPLLLKLGEALTSSGRIEAGVAVYRRLLSDDALGWEQRVDALRLLGRALLMSGALEQSELASEDAVALAVRHEPSRAVRPLLDQAAGAWLVSGPRQALPFLGRARALAVRGGADEALSRAADVAWGQAALEAGDPAGIAAVEPVGQQLANSAARPIDPSELTWSWASVLQFAMSAVYVERFEEARHAYDAANAAAEAGGAASALATFAIHRANLLTRRGQLADALHEARRAADLAELTPSQLGYTAIARARVLLYLGQLAESERCCREAERHGVGLWIGELSLAHIRGMRMLWQGDLRASELMLRVEQLNERAGVGEPCMHQWAGHAISAHLAAGREADARRVLEWVEQCAARLPCAWPRIAAELGHAELAWRCGDDAAADARFRRGLVLHAEVELPLHEIEALLAYGRFLRRRGWPVEARPSLARARELAEECGAAWLIRAARSELRLAGGRRRRAASDPDSLTAAEERVVRLAVAGRTNAEIARQLYLSVHTVQSHLKHSYAKLGISSRRQLEGRL